jgi:hypothetical protein
MNSDISWRIDSDAHLLALHRDYGQPHIRSDHDAFASAASYD